MQSLIAAPRRLTWSRPVVAPVVATVITLAVGAALELVVFGRGGHDALSDLPGRYFAWHLHAAEWPYTAHPIEYPVFIGYVAAVTSSFTRSAASFFVANGVFSAVLAIGMTVMLEERGGNRIWRWAAGIPLALYAFHNWDLVAMVPAVGGVLAFDRGKDRASGALLAFGASTKVFPGLFLVPLTVLRWCSGDRRGAKRLAGAFVLTTVVLNAPVALESWNAWTYPLRFQGVRSATWGSLWWWTSHAPGVHSPLVGNAHTAADLLVAATTVAAVVLISVLAVRRELNAVAVGAAVTGAFLLANKVYSPNYDLWIVPFFVLLPVARRVWIAFCASDLAVFVLVFGFLHGNWRIGVVEDLLPVLIVVRAATIIAVVLTALRDNEPRGTARSPSHPYVARAP